MTVTPEVTYDKSVEEFRKAAGEFRLITEAYRAKKIGDAEFLKGKEAFDKASEVANEAEAAYSKAKATPPVTYGGKGWRQDFDKTTDVSKKASILRSIADYENVTQQELEDVLTRVSGLPEESNIRWAVAHKQESMGIPVVISPEILSKFPDLAYYATPEVAEPWQMTKAEYVKVRADRLKEGVEYKSKFTSEQLHERNVKDALSEGKPVPPEVLAEYPDLAKAIPKTTPVIPEVTRQLRQMTKDEFLASFGWRNLDEAKAVIQSMPEGEVIYTPQGQEVSKQLLEGVVKDLTKIIPKAEAKVSRQTIVDYDRQYTLAELKKMCRDRSLTVSGSKKELIARLI